MSHWIQRFTFPAQQTIRRWVLSSAIARINSPDTLARIPVKVSTDGKMILPREDRCELTISLAMWYPVNVMVDLILVIVKRENACCVRRTREDKIVNYVRRATTVIHHPNKAARLAHVQRQGRILRKDVRCTIIKSIVFAKKVCFLKNVNIISRIIKPNMITHFRLLWPLV